MKRSRESSSDIISNLPNNVTESILACLPLRDAVRTSVLSTKWKNKWVTLPHLVFNRDTFECFSIDPQAPAMTDEDEVIRVISQILLQHCGPVLKFVLSICHLRSCSTIDNWLGFLSRHGIEELTLEIQTGLSHKMPSSFFSCQHLRRLKLSNCIVRPPPTFSGFKKLTSIDFKMVSCSANSLENLIASCPLLDTLKLRQMFHLHSLAINAPNLLNLSFVGESESLCSINAPHLFELSLYVYRPSNSFNLLGFLPRTMHILRLNTYPSLVLEAGNTLKNLPNTFSHLWKIVLRRFSFENVDSVACAFCLIKNAPNLMWIEMRIQTSNSPSGDVEQVLTLLKANLGLSVGLKKLSSFTIKSFDGTKPQMEFIKLILASSPVLREVTITANRAHPSYNGFTTLKELISFPRASSAAKIIYSDEE